ncbi:hypothetical protein [Sessilibacter sp. MAH4]
MKVHIEVDLTPEEARELLGFTGVDRFQQLFFNTMKSEWGKETHPMFDLYQNFVKQSQEFMEKYASSSDSGNTKR